MKFCDRLATGVAPTIDIAAGYAMIAVLFQRFFRVRVKPTKTI